MERPATRFRNLGRGRGRGAKLYDILKNLKNKDKEKIGKNEVVDTPSIIKRNNKLIIPGQFTPAEPSVPRTTIILEDYEKSDLWKLKIEKNSDCVCTTPTHLEKLVCGSCQGILDRRPQIQCKIHRTILLMDYTHCPHCEKEL